MRVLGLRTVDKDRRSWHGTFQWPASGKVVAPDWEPTPRCGQGLHALLWGIGEGRLLNWRDDAIWQAVWIDEDKIVRINAEKIKFSECEVACDGTREEVVKFMAANGADAAQMVGGIVTGHKAVAYGYNGRAESHEDYGTATAFGMHGEAIANGERGMAIARGYDGIARANGKYGIAKAKGKYGLAEANGLYGKAYGYAASAGPGGQIVVYGSAFVGRVGRDIEPGVVYTADHERLVPC